MNKLSCILVDDEPLALDLLERYVARTPFLDCRYRCHSAFEALQYLEYNTVDLLFLDIQMPELSGIELSRIVSRHSRIIFTTAFQEYALDGFRVNAIDYLLKPFNYEEFCRAANKARNWFGLTGWGTGKSSSQEAYIFVKSEYKLVKILLRDVLYFEGLKDYVKIWLIVSPKPVLSLMSLKVLESELPVQEFMRIHRSFIIALNRIQLVERGQVCLNGNVRITIAEQYRERFQQFINHSAIGRQNPSNTSFGNFR